MKSVSKHIIFIWDVCNFCNYKFEILGKNLNFYKQEKIFWRDLKKKKILDHFSPLCKFRPKMIFLDTGYILRVKTMVEFLMKHVWQISSPFAPLSIFDDMTCKEKYKRSKFILT